MLRPRIILKINNSTQQVCGELSQTGCNCGCNTCECSGTCIDIVDCTQLTIADIHMQIARAGVFDAKGHLIPLFYYTAYTLVGNKVCFLVDTSLVNLQGRYIGTILVKGVKSGHIEMQIGAPYTFCEPTTINGCS